MWATAYGESVGWENAQGHLVYYPAPFGEELAQSIKEMVADYQQRFSVEFEQMAFYSVTQLYFLTDALKKAGTVDDVDRILEAIHTETFDTWIGTVHFGGEELIGINDMQLWPAAVHEIKNHEHVLADELAVEVYGEFAK